LSGGFIIVLNQNICVNNLEQGKFKKQIIEMITNEKHKPIMLGFDNINMMYLVNRINKLPSPAFGGDEFKSCRTNKQFVF
jgi:hypothetical protein